MEGIGTDLDISAGPMNPLGAFARPPDWREIEDKRWKTRRETDKHRESPQPAEFWT